MFRNSKRPSLLVFAATWRFWSSSFSSNTVAFFSAAPSSAFTTVPAILHVSGFSGLAFAGGCGCEDPGAWEAKAGDARPAARHIIRLRNRDGRSISYQLKAGGSL